MIQVESGSSTNTLYAHAETTTIGGSSYYLHKLSSADGPATTLSQSAASIGRKLMGRWVYPLSGILSIPASTWTVTYRAMRSASASSVVAHCDIDILIRKSDNTIRTTITTNVANSPSLTLINAWETLTGTYNWPGYTVVDQTDYLEVAYYIEVTTSQSSKSVRLLVDDGTLPLADQTKIKNVIFTYPNQAPVASFTYSPADPYAQEIITFDASASHDPDGSIVSYKWDFGDGYVKTVTTSIITHAYVDCGNYTVTLTVTDNEGLASSTSQTITVINPSLLRLWADVGSYVGSHSDTWIHESWIVGSFVPPGGSVSFDLYIDAISNPDMRDPAYDVYLAVAVNDTAQVASVSIGPTTITTFTYGEVTWPATAGGGTLPRHGVYPTWYALAPFGNVTSNHGYYTIPGDPYGPYWAFRAHVSVTITTSATMSAGFKVHFDAQGTLVRGSTDPRERNTNPFSHDLTFGGALSVLIPPVARFTVSNDQPYVCETVTFDASSSYDLDGVIVKYEWDWEGDGIYDFNAGNNSIAYHHYDMYGYYYPKLRVTDNDGLTDETGTTIHVRQHPVACFDYNPTPPLVCETVTFNASSSTPNGGVIVSYTWNFDDGNITTVSNPTITHVYAAIKKYNVTLTVTDSEGLSDTAWNIVKVVTQPTSPVASFTWSPPNPTVNELITFDASSSQPGFDGFNVCPISWYYWNFGDGYWANETDPITTHAYASPGTYYVTLTVYAPPSPDDPSYDPSGNVTVPITITTGPHAEFTYSPLTPYTGETVTFNATLSYDPDGWIVSYAWDFGDSTTGSGNITTHSYADDGVYKVVLNVTDNDGLSSIASANITVLNRSPVADFTENATIVLTGEVIHFDASSSYDPDGSIATYHWDFGDGKNAWGVTADHSYSDDGMYTVTLTVTDNDGATGSANATKTVLNRAPIAVFTESAHNIGVGEVIYFNASLSSDPDGSVVSYFWSFGDGNNAMGVTTSHSYGTAGTYTVTLTVTDDDGATASANATKTVLANMPPVASFTENATTVLTGKVIHFDASASYDPDGTIVSYFWKFGDGNNAWGVAVDHSYVDDGTYMVNLTVTDDKGATGWTTATKTVLNRPPVADFTESATTVYTGQVITFNAASSYDLDGTITSYYWDFGDGDDAWGVTVSHSYSDDGTYKVTLTVTDDDGATDDATSTKTVLNRPPVAKFTESATNVVPGQVIYFDASGSNDPDGTITSYFWSFGDGDTATGVTVSHAYASTGTYKVTLTVTDDDGATASASATKMVSKPVGGYATPIEKPQLVEPRITPGSALMGVILLMVFLVRYRKQDRRRTLAVL